MRSPLLAFARARVPRTALELAASVPLACLLSACDGGGTGGSGGGGSGGSGGGAPLTVDVAEGPVEGFAQGETRAWLGIPYAAPPVGDLRWKPPAAHAAWTEPLSAKKKGIACSQNGVLTPGYDDATGEDCLTLNVWAPAAPASAALPVLFWIHGGGFVIGSGGEGQYDGQTLSEATGAIVVTVNYRLGPFGFLAHTALGAEDAAHPSSGNYGLEDQQAALRWVKENAAAFGGDPARVLLFGESAGGISVCDHLVSPGSAGLFSAAIIQSGPCETVLEKTFAEAQGDDLAAALGCAGAPADVLACLRGKTTAEVMAALPVGEFLFGDGPKWSPVKDGLVLPDHPGELLASGEFAKVPVMLGTNADEATIFFQLSNQPVPDEAAFQALAEKLMPGHGAEIVAQYPTATYGTPLAAAQAAVADGGFVCATRRMARALAAGGVDTYLYHFTFDPGPTLLGDLGSFHSAEIKYVFGNPGQLLPDPLTPDELALSAEMMGYWSRLGTSGDPNDPSAVAWPKYAAASDEHLVLDVTITGSANLKKDLCDFWDTIVP